MSDGIAKIDANPMTLLQSALEKGVTPDELRQWMDLRDRWVKEQAEAQFAQAMNACQLEMPDVVKDANNPFLKSKYAKQESVNRAIRPVYTAHGFSLSYTSEPSPINGYVRIHCDCSHVGGCTKRYSGDFAVDGTGMKGGSNMNAIQGMGSTFSYARRYLALLIFNISIVDEDTDGGPPPTRITPDQIDWLEKLLEDSGADRSKFLKWVNIDRLELMPSRDYPKAEAMLKRKIAEKGGAA